MIILITASGTRLRRLHVRRDMINIAEMKVVVLGWNLGLVWVCLFDVVLRDEFPCTPAPLKSILSLQDLPQ